jgi:hypothetical protein
MLSFNDMSVFKRLLPYILLNVFVSALVTLAVLSWWNSTSHPAAASDPGLGLSGQADPKTTQAPSRAPQSTPATAGQNAPALATATHLPVETARPSSTPQPVSVKLIEIAEVAGSGNLSTESILLRRVGDGELRLFGWKIDDEAGHRYTFPDMVLYKNGAVRLHTRTGANSVNELYWGLKDAVWVTGKTATLSDDKGNLRATLLIP